MVLEIRVEIVCHCSVINVIMGEKNQQLQNYHIEKKSEYAVILS